MITSILAVLLGFFAAVVFCCATILLCAGLARERDAKILQAQLERRQRLLASAKDEALLWQAAEADARKAQRRAR